MTVISSIAKIRARIASLEAKAQKLEKSHKSAVAQIRAPMKKYKVTISDLDSAPKSTKKAAKASATKKTKARKTKKRSSKKAAVKYRDGDGNTWTGRGLAPKWLKAAEKAGQKRDKILV
jgi:DNA-binding protein H-NS